MAAAGEGHVDRVEQGAFDEHGRRRVRAARWFAAHDAGQGLHAGAVRDRAIGRVHGVGPAVQRGQRLPGAGAQRKGTARHAVRVEHMQGPAEVDREEVGHVHQRVDRPQPDANKPPLQPRGRRPVAHAAHHPA